LPHLIYPRPETAVLYGEALFNFSYKLIAKKF